MADEIVNDAEVKTDKQVENTSVTDLLKAHNVLKEANDKRIQMCTEEVNEVLKKYNCKIATVQAFIDGQAQKLQLSVQSL